MKSSWLKFRPITGKAAHLKIGQRGEDEAVRLLKSKGYTILQRNWKRASGELDIVALDGLVLVFVEVKSRRYKPFVKPANNLRKAQIYRIKKGARKYLSQLEDNVSPPYRFDLIEVLLSRFSTLAIYHHSNTYQRRKYKRFF